VEENWSGEWGPLHAEVDTQADKEAEKEADQEADKEDDEEEVSTTCDDANTRTAQPEHFSRRTAWEAHRNQDGAGLIDAGGGGNDRTTRNDRVTKSATRTELEEANTLEEANALDEANGVDEAVAAMSLDEAVRQQLHDMHYARECRAAAASSSAAALSSSPRAAAFRELDAVVASLMAVCQHVERAAGKGAGKEGAGREGAGKEGSTLAAESLRNSVLKLECLALR